jgi:hypothetical protein
VAVGQRGANQVSVHGRKDKGGRDMSSTRPR